MSEKQPVILIGGGGHCTAVLDVLERNNTFLVKGILDKKEKIDQHVLGYQIIAADEDIPAMMRLCPNYLITIGHTKDSSVRAGFYERVKQAGGQFVTLISPLSYVSRHAAIQEGTVVMHQAMVNAGATVGCNTIINSKALIEHHARIGDHCHMATGAIVNGGCQVGDHTLIGSGAVVRQGIYIAPHVVVGAGAVVVSDLDEPGTYIGIPARWIGAGR